MDAPDPATPAARELFLDALDVPEGRQREAFVDQACGGDASLCDRVKALLAAYAKADLLKTPESFAQAVVSLVDLTPGDRVGSYELLERLGEGGFGVVFRARQEQPLKREVALKVVKLGMGTKEVMARFETERAVLARMDHPGIARVFDAGATDSGRPYFVMELVEGSPITSYGVEQALDGRARLRLFRTTCLAVQHAHQKGVIHRDLKPSNVLVTEVDGHPQPKVIDFGIAKAAGKAFSGLSIDVTGEHVVGTPAYMSPEQFEARPDVDTRADVYALGALLYELLVGEPVFDTKSASYGELQHAILRKNPPRPSTRRSQLRAQGDDQTRAPAGELPADLDWIVLRCLEKEPARRYPTASALAEDIERFLEGLPVEAAPPDLLYRARKLARRHRVVTVAGLLVFASLIVSIAATATGLLRSERARGELAGALARETKLTQRALHAEAAARREAEVSRAVNEFLTDDLLASAAPSTEAGRGLDVAMRDVLDGAARRIDGSAGAGGRLADKPEAVAAVVGTLGNTYAALGGFIEAVPHLERALKMQTEQLGAADPATLRIASQLGRSYNFLGRSQEGLALLEATLAVQRRVHAESHRDTIDTLSRLCSVYTALKRDDDAEAVAVEALEMADRTLPRLDARRGRLLLRLAVGQMRRERWSEAAELLQDALEIFTTCHGEMHEETLAVRQNLGTVHLYTGELDQAEPMLRRAMEVSLELLGPDHPGTLAASSNLADVLRSLDRREEALPLQKAAYQGYGRSLGPNHRATYISMNAYAVLCDETGRFEEAERVFRKNAPMAERLFGATHRFTTNIWRNVATALHERGEHIEASELLSDLLDREREAGVATAAATVRKLAACLRCQGRNEEAKAVEKQR